MDKQNAHNVSEHFSVRISEWATYISLFVSHPLSTFVSHTIWCFALSTFVPHLSHTWPVDHIWDSHHLYTSQRSHIWALQPVSVATLSHPIVYKHCIKATLELCIPIRSHIWASHLRPPIVFHISLRPHWSSQIFSRIFFRPNFRAGYWHKLHPHLRFIQLSCTSSTSGIPHSGHLGATFELCITGWPHLSHPYVYVHFYKATLELCSSILATFESLNSLYAC
jgi:hypothetical protein